MLDKHSERPRSPPTRIVETLLLSRATRHVFCLQKRIFITTYKIIPAKHLHKLRCNNLEYSNKMGPLTGIFSKNNEIQCY